MTVDGNGRPHAPAGTNHGGRFTAYTSPEANANLDEDALRRLDSGAYNRILDAKLNGDDWNDDDSATIKRVFRDNGAMLRLSIIENFPIEFDELAEEDPTYAGWPEYDSANNYWDNAAIARHPETTTETLDEISDHETEDDFMLAVARHKNASPYALGRAAEHSSYTVQLAVLNHERTPQASIEKLKTKATVALPAAERAAVGVSPDQSYREWEVNQLKAVIEAANRRTP